MDVEDEDEDEEDRHEESQDITPNPDTLEESLNSQKDPGANMEAQEGGETYQTVEEGRCDTLEHTSGSDTL